MIINVCALTHLSRMEFPTIINWTSLFPLVGGVIFHFYSNFNRTFYKQTVNSGDPDQTPHLIWVCTVCICPTKRSPGLYGLSSHCKTQLTTVINGLKFRQ